MANKYLSSKPDMDKWDSRFIDLAKLVASWSKDTTKVGAVIVDNQRRVVSLGFNGPPRGVVDGYKDRTQKLRRTIHGEKNALAFATRSVVDCSMYITHPPCSQCTAYMIQQGINRVIFLKGSEDFMSRWQEEYDESLAMFLEASVIVVPY